MPILLSRPALVPVLELSPGDFATTARPTPNRTGREAPDEWRAYWKAAIADQHLVLEPLAFPGSWSVPVADLTDLHTIRVIAFASGRLRENLATPDELPIEERTGALDGGFAIANAGDILWHDACCARLADFGEWRELFESPPGSNFLAHTWVFTTQGDACVNVSVRQEYSKTIDDEFQIPLSATSEMLEIASEQLRQFKARLSDALRSHVPEEKRNAIVNALMGE